MRLKALNGDFKAEANSNMRVFPFPANAFFLRMRLAFDFLTTVTTNKIRPLPHSEEPEMMKNLSFKRANLPKPDYSPLIKTGALPSVMMSLELGEDESCCNTSRLLHWMMAGVRPSERIFCASRTPVASI
ncbi:MAG TPA: hypothetical protein VHS96_01430, partial [Bacteroidia bacterium]|nr:hypothetical protein [Bacteroidia bacterium]